MEVLQYWEFRKIGVPYLGPYNKDPTNFGYYIRVPYVRKPPYASITCQGGCLRLD